MPTLPTDGEINWGRKLNEFLLVSHKEDGQLRNVYEVINVKDFGAIGDGLSHPLANYFTTLEAAKALYPQAEDLQDEIDGAAIQAAIATLSPNGGTVYIPKGIYLVKGITISDKHVHLVGAGGPGQEIGSDFIAPTIIRSVSDRPIILYTTAERNTPKSRFCTIRDLAVVGSVNSGMKQANQHGIQIDNRGLSLTNVGVWGASGHGVFFSDSVASRLINVLVTHCGCDGFHIDNTEKNVNGETVIDGIGAFATTMIGCGATLNQRDGYHAERSGNGTTSLGLVVEQNARYGIYLNGADNNKLSRFSRFYGTWDEINGKNPNAPPQSCMGMDCGGSVYFGAGALQNLVDYVRWSSRPPVYETGSNQNVVWGTDLTTGGNDLDLGVGRKVRAFNQDREIRFRNREDTADADVFANIFHGVDFRATERMTLFPDDANGVLILWDKDRLTTSTSVANIEAQGNRTLQMNAPEIMLATGQIERVRIHSSGNVGIGTTEPQTKLHVAGVVKATGCETGDIIFVKDSERLWRMYEAEAGLLLENLKTHETSKVILESDFDALKAEIAELRKAIGELTQVEGK